NAVNEGIRPELPSRHRHQSSPGSETNRMNLIIKIGLKRLAISESNCRNLKNSSNNNSAGEEHIQKITEYITEYVGVWNKDFFEPRKIKIDKGSRGQPKISKQQARGAHQKVAAKSR
ncbi:16291_t:CDS:2, partial [Entrophospora sp. SA101]